MYDLAKHIMDYDHGVHCGVFLLKIILC